MFENTNNDSKNRYEVRKERFEFVLSVNDTVVCQRYFWINKFKDRSYYSIDLVEAIERCSEIINESLKDKTSFYLYNSAPMLFDTVGDMKAWINGVAHKTLRIPPMSYIVVKDDGSKYVWDGNEATEYNGTFSIDDYVGNNENYTFKFEFIDNGTNFREYEEKRVVCSKIWDGKCFPKFVIDNIDLTNSRNKYKSDSIYAPVEHFIVDEYNKSKRNAETGEVDDVISKLITEIMSVCSYDDNSDYDTSIKMTNDADDNSINYNLNLFTHNRRYLNSLEDKKKTAEYFGKKG